MPKYSLIVADFQYENCEEYLKGSIHETRENACDI